MANESWITHDTNDDTTLRIIDSDTAGEAVFNNPSYSFDGGISLPVNQAREIDIGHLTKKEITMLGALIKLLVDQDLYDTLMETLGMDADAAMATAFRGMK